MTKKLNKPENDLPVVAKNVTKHKETWPEEFWKWTSDMLKWVLDSLFNTLAAWWELVMSWVSKLSEKFWSEDSEVVSSRKTITNHHLNQTKKSLNNVKDKVLDVCKWWFKATKWALRTVLLSWEDTIKSLREGDTKNSKTHKKAA